MSPRYKAPTSCIVLYSCGHNRVYPLEHAPGVFEDAVCVKCNRQVVVVTAGLTYRTRCRDCTHSQNHGASKLNAELAGAKHRKRRPTHTVDLLYGAEKIRTFTPQSSMIFTKTLPNRPVNDLELPPF